MAPGRLRPGYCGRAQPKIARRLAFVKCARRHANGPDRLGSGCLRHSIARCPIHWIDLKAPDTVIIWSPTCRSSTATSPSLVRIRVPAPIAGSRWREDDFAIARVVGRRDARLIHQSCAFEIRAPPRRRPKRRHPAAAVAAAAAARIKSKIRSPAACRRKIENR